MQTKGLLQIAKKWVRANCPLAQRSFIETIDRTQKRRGSCSITIGKALTKRGKPYLVQILAGEMFVFELTPRQAKNLNVVVDGMRCAESLPPSDWWPVQAPVVELTNLVIDNHRRLVIGEPMTGRCSHAMHEQIPGPLALHLHIAIPGHCTYDSSYLWHRGFGTEGTLEFTFPRVKLSPDDQLTSWTGTTTAFARFSTAVDPQHEEQPTVPLSNVCCVLLDMIG
ncbi:MAG TPA: hypothetical protein VND64_32690 [Pirellulales bacterium]|nr:hypothetical protein [Pirellulales bacterium]